MILLFSGINNPHIGTITISVGQFSSSHRQQRAVKVFIYCFSIKGRFENLAEKEEGIVVTASLLITN